MHNLSINKEKAQNGTFVKSRYAASWTGVIVERKNRKANSDILLILVVRDAAGQTPRKRIIKRLAQDWTIPVERIDIQHINPDWFKNIEPL